MTNHRLLLILAVIILLIVESRATDFSTKLRFSTEAVDRFLCPFISRSINARLRSAASFIQPSATDGDQSASKFAIGTPPADTQCRYELDPARNALRLLLAWTVPDSGEVRADLDFAWRNGITVECNGSSSTDGKSKTQIDDAQSTGEALCKDLTEYFTQTPTIVVHPIWADLNLIYALRSAVVSESGVDFDLSTYLEPPNDAVSSSISVSLSPASGGTIQMASDLNVISAIFDSMYQKHRYEAYRLSSKTVDELKMDCGQQSGIDAECLGAHMQSIFPTGDPTSNAFCDFRFDSPPVITIDPEHGIVLRASGRVRLGWDESESVSRNDSDNLSTTAAALEAVQAQFASRIICRLHIDVTSDKKLKGVTSLRDLALMTSNFDLRGIHPSHEAYNRTTDQIVRSIAPILIDQINRWMNVGLPLPFPASMRLVNANAYLDRNDFGVISEIGQ